jgi:hypothetical protein
MGISPQLIFAKLKEKKGAKITPMLNIKAIKPPVPKPWLDINDKNHLFKEPGSFFTNR